METSNVVFSSEEQTTASMDPQPPSLASVHAFTVLDFCLFTAMLVFSALIGIYFAFFAKQKQNTTSEYLMGGKTMGITPVSMSLIASYISGITLLGMSAEMYTYGTQYCSVLIGLLIATVVCGIFFLPVFFKLQLNTSYEYLEVRFDRKVRLLGSILFIISNLLYIPIVIYVPAIAISQKSNKIYRKLYQGQKYLKKISILPTVTGANLHLITPLFCLVCIFYTSLGGLKAVVWTDALQTVMMFGAMIVVIWIGTNAVGGFSVVWERNEKSGRIELFNLNPDPTIRHTFWNTAFGTAFTWGTHLSVNQAMVQRFLAMSEIKRAQIMTVIFCIGVSVITAMSFYAGMLMYALYYDCDLISTKVVGSSDQLLPYFVMDVGDSVPGLPGLFMAGVFSAALSSMSTGLNSMSGVLYEDFIHPYLKHVITEERASFIMKIICVIVGIICIGMVFVVEHLGAVLQISGSFRGVTSGPLLAIFVLGMFFPWTNSKGALTGGIVGLIIMGYISFGTHAAVASGKIHFEKKPFSVEGCPTLPESIIPTMEAILNATESSHLIPSLAEETPAIIEGPMAIFRISYILYTLMGFTISVSVGLLVSFLTGATDPADVHIDLLTPAVQHFFVNRCKGTEIEENFKSSRDPVEHKEQGESLVLLNTLSDNHTGTK